MGEFFKFPFRFVHGLNRRQRISLVTLLLALMFMAGWMRSLFMLDRFFFSQNKSGHAILSMDGTISWRSRTPFSDNLSVGWPSTLQWIPSELTQNSRNNYKFYWNDGDVHWHWQLLRFDFGAATFEAFTKAQTGTFRQRDEIWQIPYWSIVLPLAFISLWLLLTKPRQSTQKKITEPIPTEGK